MTDRPGVKSLGLCRINGQSVNIHDRQTLSGPPPRPLDLLQSKVQDNKVYCIYQDFRLGITQQQQI